MSNSSDTAMLQKISAVWKPLDAVVGGMSVHSAADYKRVKKLVNALLDEVGEDETHSLAPMLDYLAFQLEAYEDEHVKIPVGEPAEVLRLLMQEQGLNQSSFAPEIPQSRISDVLNGRRRISVTMAKVFAERFGVGVEVFV